MQAYLELGRICVIIPMSFVCSSIATPDTDDDLPSAFFNAGYLTYTGWCGCIPLCEGTWHGLTADGAGSFQQITWTALEADH